jgi:hypothetical protein
VGNVVKGSRIFLIEDKKALVDKTILPAHNSKKVYFTTFWSGMSFASENGSNKSSGKRTKDRWKQEISRTCLQRIGSLFSGV